MKKLLAILLAAMLLLSLTACKSNNTSSGPAANAGNSSGQGDSSGTDANAANPSEQGAAVGTDAYADDPSGRTAVTVDQLIGTWQADIHMMGTDQAETMLDLMLTSMNLGFTPTAAQRAEMIAGMQNAGEFHIRCKFTLNSDGTTVTAMDASEATKIIDWMLAFMPSMLRVILPEMLEQQLAQNGISMSAEDYLKNYAGMTLEEYIGATLEQMEPGLRASFEQNFKDGKENSGYYELRDGKLYTWDDENPDGRTKGGITCEIRNGKLYWLQVDDLDTMSNGNMDMSSLIRTFLPLELTRVN